MRILAYQTAKPGLSYATKTLLPQIFAKFDTYASLSPRLYEIDLMFTVSVKIVYLTSFSLFFADIMVKSSAFTEMLIKNFPRPNFEHTQLYSLLNTSY